MNLEYDKDYTRYPSFYGVLPIFLYQWKTQRKWNNTYKWPAGNLDAAFGREYAGSMANV